MLIEQGSTTTTRPHPTLLKYPKPNHATTPPGQLVCLLFPVPAAGIDTPVASLNAQEGPPFEVSGALYTQLLEEQEGMERLELSGPRVESIKPRRGREWLGRWRRRP